MAIEKPDGSVREAVGMVEFARVAPGIEAQALVFAEFELADVPAGTRIRVLSAVEAQDRGGGGG